MNDMKLLGVPAVLLLLVGCVCSFPTTGSWIEFDGNELALIQTAKNNSQDLVIVEGIGNMYGKPIGSECVDYWYNVTHLQQLLSVLALAEKLGMDVAIGILQNPEAPEWGVCLSNYVDMTVQAVYEILPHIKQYKFFWYITQEPGLNFMFTGDDQKCEDDGETSFYMAVTNALASVTPGRQIMSSPYYNSSMSTPKHLAHTFNRFLTCAGNVSIIAPQDGVGSFNNSISLNAEIFSLFKQNLPSTASLWANVETFFAFR
eukprot:TRINITY_DN498_c0_g2_i1.p1 TRINITY_DN498_c0_g2~~TRINITY_DN498_c0_g2_i1.p1  ORF type:complete len:259 (+),score=43.58 TRINITY_DN498_c0_g2_i1:780-1556(+)